MNDEGRKTPVSSFFLLTSPPPIPPDLQEEAVKTVLMQAELLCAELA